MRCLTAVRTTKVTPSPLKSAGLPVASPDSDGIWLAARNLRFLATKITPGVRIRRRIGVPGAWHSQQSHPLQPRASLRILTVWMLGGTANLKSPTLRIPPRLRGGGCQSYPALSCSTFLSVRPYLKFTDATETTHTQPVVRVIGR